MGFFDNNFAARRDRRTLLPQTPRGRGQTPAQQFPLACSRSRPTHPGGGDGARRCGGSGLQLRRRRPHGRGGPGAGPGPAPPIRHLRWRRRRRVAYDQGPRLPRRLQLIRPPRLELRAGGPRLRRRLRPCPMYVPLFLHLLTCLRGRLLWKIWVAEDFVVIGLVPRPSCLWVLQGASSYHCVQDCFLPSSMDLMVEL
jgi:hypothetical protein